MTKIRTLVEKINNGDNALFRQLYGNDASVLKQQAERYESLMREFEEAHGTEDVELFSSPGRTEVGGNHTDHQFGRVLAGAVNMDNIAVVAKNDSDVIKIKSAGYPEFTVDISDLSKDESKLYTSEALVKGICARMKELGYNIGGFTAHIHGNVLKGSGLSSSASFEVLIGAIISHLFNDGKIDPVVNAQIGQWAENNYFGKPCGLMDQTACSVGGFITIDFKDPSEPVVKALDFDFMKTGYVLVITDTGGDHANLNDEYASLPSEMKSVAQALGKSVMREVSYEELLKAIPEIRSKVGDRAILRAIHFLGDNERVVSQVEALESNRFDDFLRMVIASGNSSYMYNQNVYTSHDSRQQSVALGLALSAGILEGKGAWRVHGGGFAGTIQAFVPQELLDEYVNTLESVFGAGHCHKLFIRTKGSIKLEL
ncbi:MAG: galactokinase [Chlorobi bacterium]|nr:galactokinase [Chlorobiota bacterium]